MRTLPASIGVYALCDLDEVPIYVGQSVDGIRARVRRHLTSARSDVIANRQVDVWEIAFVWAWTMPREANIEPLKSRLIHELNSHSSLVNASIPQDPGPPGFDRPDRVRVRVQVMDDREIESRRDPTLRFPRQIQHFNSLVDYILNTQDKPHLRRALEVYFNRLSNYYSAFIEESRTG